jgi:hypothetical protein
MEAQIVGGLGHQGIERRIAGEAENIIDAIVLRFWVRLYRAEFSHTLGQERPSRVWFPCTDRSRLAQRHVERIVDAAASVAHGG